jgi:uncharacterized membrane protein (GlpM family)
MQLLWRFLMGGFVVSLFALTGDLLSPKSFAGLFGAAPSVALVTLALTASPEGVAIASIEARSMFLAAGAFIVYAAAVCSVMRRGRWPAALVSVAGLLLWGVCAAGALSILWRLPS